MPRDDVQYSINFTNNSRNDGNVCVYQQQPDIQPQFMSLAWFTKYASKGEKDTFKWDISYNFVWEQTGVLQSGVVFDASQNPQADLTKTNQITLTKVPNQNDFNFIKQGPETPAGTLYLHTDNTIPFNTVSAGIGMYGQGTFVIQAQPNENYMFTPHPEYWIAFGNYQQGEVLDISNMTLPYKIVFPDNVYAMQATLTENNTWIIQPVTAPVPTH